MSLTVYLDLVSDFWHEDSRACARCDFYDAPDYCEMLHDHSVPNGDCLGVLERDNIKQPSENDK